MEIFTSQDAPPVSTKPVANLPPLSMTPAANFATGTAGVIDTGKLVLTMPAGNLLPVSTTMVGNRHWHQRYWL